MFPISLLTDQPRGRWPFRRRRSRLARLRDLIEKRARSMSGSTAAQRARAATATATERAREVSATVAERARDATSVAADRAREVAAAAPDIARAAAAARGAVAERLPSGISTIGLPSIALPLIPTPGFLHDGLSFERLPVVGRRERSAWEKLSGGDAPVWTIALSAVAGFAIGIGVGMWLTSRRETAEVTRAAAKKLEAAADEIKAAWPDVTDDDIQRARGSADRLAETIRTRTGEAADKILAQLEGITSGAGSTSNQRA